VELLLVALLLTASPGVQVHTLAGASIEGRIAALADESLTITTAAGEQSLPLKDVQSIVGGEMPSTLSTPATWIKLVDESQIIGSSFTVAGEDAHVARLDGEELVVPTRLIDSVRFRENFGAAAGQWDEIAAPQRSGDLLVSRKNDALDFFTGVIHDVTNEAVNFELDGEALRVKRPKVEGLLYHKASGVQLAPSRGVLRDAGGSQFQVARLKVEGDRVQVRTAAGLEVVLALTQVARIDFAQGDLQYLAELKPESAVWTPYFGDANTSPATRAFFQPHFNRSMDGGPLQLGGKEFTKGIAAHSRTELVYRLPDKFRSFQALVGIDDRLRPGGNVHLQVLGDDRTLFEDTITGKDEPRPLELDITGVNRLKLLVDFGEMTDVGDALDFCEARILK
jgi:hypothetical protein